ncbi:hypothetical protein Tco_1575312 [Tanacetum coccineum]
MQPHQRAASTSSLVFMARVLLKILDASLLCLTLSDLSFSGGGNSEEVQQAKLAILISLKCPLYSSLEGNQNILGTAEGSAEARCSSSSSSSSSFSTSSTRCIIQMTHYHNCLLHRQDGEVHSAIGGRSFISSSSSTSEAQWNLHGTWVGRVLRAMLVGLMTWTASVPDGVHKIVVCCAERTHVWTPDGRSSLDSVVQSDDQSGVRTESNAWDGMSVENSELEA